MRAGIVAGVAFATALVPAVAEAGTAYTDDYRGGAGTYSKFDAFQGEQNQVQLRMSGTTDTYRDPGVGWVSPFRENDLTTISDCAFRGFYSATCKRSATNGPLVYLEDGDDSIDVDAAAGQPPAFVDGGDGADAARGNSRVVFNGGRGADTLDAGPGSIFRYADDDRAVDLTIDLDGVADDGAPGEGDNVRPGAALEAFIPGNHTITGSDIADQLRSGRGSQTITGLAGADELNGGFDADEIDGGPGDDALSGDYGDDTIHAQDGEVDRIDCGPGTDTAYLDATDVPLFTDMGCETVILG